MATNKKSFVLYADLLQNIEHLTNEEKGILFNHLLEYVNDKDPVLTDRLLITAWKPIELQLKRDLVKFKESKDERQRSGRIGNLKRWNPDLYKLFADGEKTLEEVEKIADSRKSSHSDKNNPIAIESVANIAVNVNDNVNVNVNDNVNNILLKKESKEKNLFENENSNFEQPEIQKEKKVAPKKEKFIPPELQDVVLYCQERNNDVIPEKFVNFYTSKGWKVGNQPMKDWKAAVRTWEQKDKKNGNNTQQQPANTSGFANPQRKKAYKFSAERVIEAYSSGASGGPPES